MAAQTVWVIIIVFILLIVVAICGVFSIMSARDLSKNPNHSTDPQLSTAYRYMIVCSTISWIAIAGIIIGTVLYFIYGSSSVSVTLKYLIGFVGIILIALAIIMGILSSIAVTKMNDSTKFNPGSMSDLAARSKAQWVAGLSLGTTALLIIGLMLFLTAKSCPTSYGVKEIYGEAKRHVEKIN